MKFVKFILITVAHRLARIDFIASGFYSLLHSLDLSEHSVLRLESYIFSNRQLRQQRKRASQVNRRGEKILRRTAKRGRLRLRSTIVTEEEGKSIVSFGVLVLRFCETHGLRFIPSILFALLDRTKISRTRVDAFHQRVYGTVKIRLVDSTQVDFRRVRDLMNGSPDLDTDRLSRSLGAQKVFHIFVEPGATLPAYLNGAAFEHAKLVIYAFDDIGQQIDALGLTRRVKLAQLRDRFNDISPEGIDLFQKAIDFSEMVVADVVTELVPHISEYSDRAREVVRTCFDGRASLRMTLMSCFENGMKNVRPGEAIVFLACSDMYVNRGWNTLKAVMDPDRAFILFAGVKRRGQEEFYKKLSRRLSAPWDVRPVNTEKVESAPVSDIKEHFVEAFDDISEISARYASNIKTAFKGQACSVFAYGERAAAYTDTLRTFGTALVRENEAGKCAAPIFLYCAGADGPSDVIKEVLGTVEDSDAVSLNFAPFSQAIQARKLNRAGDKALTALVYAKIQGKIELHDHDVADLLLPGIVRVITTQLLWVHASYSFALALSDHLPISGTFASPSRNWLVRTFCAGLLDGNQSDRPVIDIQSMNTLAHPKYRAPMANSFSVIDTTARDIYVNYFEVPEDRIKLIGAPQNDLVLDAAADVDAARIRDELGIDHQSKVILFVSQLQPFERMARIAAPLAELTQKHENYHLIVRLHPRETPERMAAYKALIEKSVAPNRVIFSKVEDPVSLLAISDVCVTIYSNMAREAVMLDVPVVIANYLDWEPPIRLDQEGLAQASFSEIELQENVRLSIEARYDGRRTAENKYLDDNRHIVEGRATTRLLEHFYEQLDQANAEFSDEYEYSSESEFIPKPLRVAKQVSIVMTGEMALVDLPPIFDAPEKVTIFSSRPNIERGILSKNCTVDQGKYTIDSADFFENSVRNANHLARVSVDSLIDALEPAPDLQDLIRKLRDPFWMRVRPRLIREQNSMANIERGIALSAEHTLVISSYDLPMIKYLVDLAMKENPTREILILLVDKDLTWKLLSPSEFEPVLAAHLEKHAKKAKNLQIEEELERQQREKRKVFDELNRFAKELQRMRFGIPKKSRVLATTDWRLKTVPGTLGPVIHRVLDNDDYISIANVRDADVSVILGELNSSRQNSKRFSVFSPGDFGPKIPFLVDQTLRSFVRLCQRELSENADFLAASPTTQKMMLSNIDVTVRTYFRTICAWYQYCQEFFDRTNTVSLACPGRQWHAEVAHIAAEETNNQSITLQNAYMAAGYTYTKPTGRYITAIDNWSKDLFVDHYGIEPDRVHVISTPRFDYLSELIGSDSAKARANLNLSSDQPTVLFAAQVGLEAEMEKIISALAQIDSIGGRVPEIIVKLHPRSSTEEVRRYEAAANASKEDHTLNFVRTGNIADYLTASDLVITVYSNVGTEAAVMGKPLIIAKFGELPLPVPMDEFGFSYVARTPDELIDSVARYFEDDEFAREQALAQQSYRDGNPAMVDGNSLDIIADVVTDAIHGGGRLSKRKAPIQTEHNIA